MDDLKQREQYHEAEAKRINAGRKPKFSDLMRNPWASEINPIRDGYFVRQISTGPNAAYVFTDRKGKFWETSTKYAFFIDGATSPAPAVVQMTDEQKLRLRSCIETGVAFDIVSRTDADVIISASGAK